MTSILHPDDRRWLDQHVREWVDAGLLQPDQADAILRAEAADEPTTPGLPALAELFVYLGLVFVAVGSTFVVTRFWEDLGGPLRLAIGAAVAAIGLVGGRALRRVGTPPFDRLAGVAELAGTGGAALTAGIAAVLFDAGNEVTTLAAGASALMVAVPLWWNRERPLQLLAVAASVAATTSGVMQVASIDDPPAAVVGPTTWVVGATVVVLALVDRLRPATVALLVGGGTAVSGGLVLTDVAEALGLLTGLGTAGVMVAVGLHSGRTPVTVLAVIAFLQLLAATLTALVAGPAAALALLVAGGGIVVVALRRVMRAAPDGAGPRLTPPGR